MNGNVKRPGLGSPRDRLAPLAGGLVGGVALWQRRPAPAPALSSVPGIKHPIEAVASAAPATAGPPDVAQALTDLLGHKATLTYLQLDDFQRRFVATVDNLDRAHAAASLWPINPAPEFADPALEALSSGQKIMLRDGPVNERRLKARLPEFRRAITRHSDARR